MKTQDNQFMRKLLGFLKALAVPVAVYVLFGLLSGGRMFTTRGILNTLRQSVQPAIICYTLLMGLSIGMMNFATGAIVCCAAVIGSGISNLLGWGLIGFIFWAMVIALATSAVMGVLYNLLRVPSMILGLGLLLVYESLPRVFFPGGAVIKTSDAFLCRQPWVFVVMAVVMVIFYIIYNKTAFGHNIRAIGANQSVALAAGLKLDSIKFKNFVFGGIFLGIAAVLYLSNNGKLQNQASMGSMAVMMDSFMAVFLGMLLTRWVDGTFAVFFGTLTMKAMSSGFIAVGMSATWEDVISGAFMLVIVAVSANAEIPQLMKANKKFAAEANSERMTKTVQRKTTG